MAPEGGGGGGGLHPLPTGLPGHVIAQHLHFVQAVNS